MSNLPDELARLWHRLNEGTPAIPEAEKAVARARGAADRAAEVEALGDLEVAYVLAERYADALPVLERTITLARKLRDYDTEAAAYFRLALLQNMLQQPGAVVDSGSKAAKMLKYQERDDLLIELLPILGDAHVALMQDGKAISVYKELIALLKSAGRHEDRAAYTTVLIVLLVEAGRAQEAIDTGNAVYGDFIEAGNKVAQAVVCTGLAGAYLKKGDLDLALGSHLNAAAMATEAGMPQQAALNLIGAGRAQMELGKGREAAGNFAEAYLIGQQQGATLLQAQALHGIARYNMDEGLYSEAAEGLEKAAKLLEGMRAEEDFATATADLLLDVYSDLGSTYTSLGRPERAKAIYQKADALEEALEDMDWDGDALD